MGSWAAMEWGVGCPGRQQPHRRWAEGVRGAGRQGHVPTRGRAQGVPETQWGSSPGGSVQVDTKAGAVGLARGSAPQTP